MDLPNENHVLRYAPFTRLHRDENDKIIGVLPQAFELRLEKGEQYLSVNWLEYFKGDRSSNINASVKSFRESRERTGKKSAFCIGNVGNILETCTTCKFPRVRIVYDTPRADSSNKSHSKIIRLPENDTTLLELFASDVFNDLIFNSDITED